MPVFVRIVRNHFYGCRPSASILADGKWSTLFSVSHPKREYDEVLNNWLRADSKQMRQENAINELLTIDSARNKSSRNAKLLLHANRERGANRYIFTHLSLPSLGTAGTLYAVAVIIIWINWSLLSHFFRCGYCCHWAMWTAIRAFESSHSCAIKTNWFRLDSLFVFLISRKRSLLYSPHFKCNRWVDRREKKY